MQQSWERRVRDRAAGGIRASDGDRADAKLWSKVAGGVDCNGAQWFV